MFANAFMENSIQNKSVNWEQFFIEMQSKGRYAFTFEELKNYFNLSNDTLLKGLHRYKKKKQVAQIRKGFYAIIPPEYSRQQMLPPQLFIDDLMKSLNKPYYVALLSAAALYGAAHQQPMEYFVIAQTPAPRNIKSKKLKITFTSKVRWDNDALVQKNTNTGYINVSSPELTALDLLLYVNKIGLNRVVTILEELVQSMKYSLLLKTAKKFSETPAIQRLGYMLDRHLKEEKLSEALLKVINERTSSPIPLSIQKTKLGELDEKWNVIINTQIESDL